MDSLKLQRRIARAIGRQRRLVRDLALITFLRKPRPSPFACALTYYPSDETPDEGWFEWSIESFSESTTSEEKKDRLVERVRWWAAVEPDQDAWTVAVWWASTGWLAPMEDDAPRPRKHPERKHGVLVFESTEQRDDAFFHDGSEWASLRGGSGCIGGRFTNLIGRPPDRGHLQVIK